MKRLMVIEIIVFLFALLFFYAGGTKLLDYRVFVGQIGKSPLLADYAGFIAGFIPAVEIIVASLLLVIRTRLVALYASFVLMSLFTFYIIAIMSLGTELPCACGGVFSMLHWKGHLVFNIVFVLLAALGIHLLSKQDDGQHVTIQGQHPQQR